MKQLWRRVALALVASVLALAAVLLLRTQRFASRQISVAPVDERAVDEAGAVERLSAAVKLRTISHQDRARMDRAAFEELHTLLATSFPNLTETLEVERVAELSVLYRWPGSEPALAPVVLMAHLDVVPIANPDAWTKPPFSGMREGGFVWGRGTMDDKGSALAILEAVEALLKDGHVPRRTILLAFGHDEEIGGRGAAAIVARLKERGIVPYLVLDEGSVIAEHLVPGIARPVALVGITEKGYATFDIVAKGKGGHSSMPPPSTAAGVIARAVQRVESHPLAATLQGPVATQLDYLGPEMTFGLRLAMANRWLFGGIIKGIYVGKPTTAAQLRTTTAVTMLSGSIKENVLPARASASVNFRIKPGETVASVQQHLEQLLEGYGVEIQLKPGASDPPPPASVDGATFAVLQRTIGEVFPGAVVAPSLVVATTDARHYAGLCDDVYRFLPIRLGPDDVGRFHGVDERISVQDYVASIRFYARLIENTSD